MPNWMKKKLDDCVKDLNLSPGLQLTLKECIRAGKQSVKTSKRYTSDWLLTCLLLHIKSPSAYEFLRNNEVLPLPCTSTIRKYLGMVKTKCGFDEKFFEAFARKLNKMDDMHRHGMLVFDEMQVRKSTAVNLDCMKYDGYIDFGEPDLTELSKKTKARKKKDN